MRNVLLGLLGGIGIGIAGSCYLSDEKNKEKISKNLEKAKEKLSILEDKIDNNLEKKAKDVLQRLEEKRARKNS